jgi:hypothetical protein
MRIYLIDLGRRGAKCLIPRFSIRCCDWCVCLVFDCEAALSLAIEIPSLSVDARYPVSFSLTSHLCNSALQYAMVLWANSKPISS